MLLLLWTVLSQYHCSIFDYHNLGSGTVTKRSTATTVSNVYKYEANYPTNKTKEWLGERGLSRIGKRQIVIINIMSI